MYNSLSFTLAVHVSIYCTSVIECSVFIAQVYLNVVFDFLGMSVYISNLYDFYHSEFTF